MGSIAFIAACGAVLVPFKAPPPGSAPGAAPGGVQAAVERLVPFAPSQDDPAPSLPVISGNGPEARLIAAYIAVGQGDGHKAFDLASALVRDHPEFSLAQMLYGDLLSTRAGAPSSFGSSASSPAAAADDGRLALHEEALRRLAALRERPPVGQVPVDFVSLPSSIRHAVAVDTSRSRLYLFANGPDGLRLERDFYVSLGKQGVAKQVEGDRRTPLGVYWITAALNESHLDQRFGRAALRFNYPNAVDRIEGRTGTGLFLHGVPPTVLTHVPWATDGCVAMANDDVVQLLRSLDVDTTPVVIARELHWARPGAMPAAAVDFGPALKAWDEARRHVGGADVEKWYAAGVAIAPETAKDDQERLDQSIVSWGGGETPMMVVTSRQKTDKGLEGTMSRQYWAHRDGQWRILFDGAVSVSEPAAARAAPPRTAVRRAAKARAINNERRAVARAQAGPRS